MEFTRLKTYTARKYTFLPCAFLVSRHGIFKMHLAPCVFLVFWRCVFLNILGAFKMQFLLKSVFFLCILAPVSHPCVFFLRLGHLCLVRVYLFYTRVEIGLVRLLRMYFLPRALCMFFGKRIFRRHLWKQKSYFCCKCILAANVFLRSSVLLFDLRSSLYRIWNFQIYSNKIPRLKSVFWEPKSAFKRVPPARICSKTAVSL